MKIEFNIDPSKLTDDMKGVMASLSDEERKELAKNALMTWLNSPISAERDAFEAGIITELKGTRDHAGDSDQRIREGYTFRNRQGAFKSSKEEMVKSIREAVISYHKEQVVKAIQEDPQLNEVMKATLEEIKKNFGAYVHDAMMAWFCSNMNQMAHGVAMGLSKTNDMDNLRGQINDMSQKLMQRGIY